MNSLNSKNDIYFKVLVRDDLFSYETDFRELVSAFYPYVPVHVVQKSMDELFEGAPSGVTSPMIIDLTEPFTDYIIDTSKPRKQIKNEIKKILYKYLSEKRNIELPWGALTGIRPVNIVTSIVENKQLETWQAKDENIDYDKIKKHLQNEYFVSDKKSDELINIAKKELEILDRPEVKNYKDEYSLYIGVPFCKSTCLYCSFTSYDINKNKKNVPLYLDALEKEFKNRKLEKSPMTIYIGGGTPTSLNDEDFEKFLCIIDENVDKKNVIEYTVEAGRPDTITESKLSSMKEHNVTRISINPQTFNQKTLDLIGRKHTVEDIYEKYNLSMSKYIKNINMDLIIGLPEESIEDIEYSINKTLELSPTSITIHSLALKRAARLNLEKNIWIDKVNVDNQNKILEMFNLVQDKIENAKYERINSDVNDNKINDKINGDIINKDKQKIYHPYYMYRQKNIAGNLENIGYAKDGYESIYNIMMMSERHTVLAFGCGGVSKIVTRCEDGSYKVERDEGYKGLSEYLGLL